jgi:hypothetical protein
MTGPLVSNVRVKTLTHSHARWSSVESNPAGEQSMSFGFDKFKKPAQRSEQELDLSGLTMQTPEVPAEKEKRALAKGEALGFTSREPDELKAGQGRVVRRHQRTPTRSLYIQGPASVLDRFVAYTNELQVSAYWEVLDKLLSQKGR